jgi:hypothetical protein
MPKAARLEPGGFVHQHQPLSLPELAILSGNGHTRLHEQNSSHTIRSGR